MFLNPKKAVKEGWLRGIPEEFIQPNAVDIPINKLWKIDKKSIFHLLHNDKRHRHREKILAKSYLEYNLSMWFLDSNQVYDFFSEAYVEMPERVVGWLVTRSTLNRNGVFVYSSLYDSGYKGYLNGSLYILGGPTLIEPGSRVAQFILAESDSEGVYAGGYSTNLGKLPAYTKNNSKSRVIKDPPISGSYKSSVYREAVKKNKR